MSKVVRHSSAREVASAEIRSLIMLAQDFNQKLNSRLKKVVLLRQIEQWDDPDNITLLESRLEALAAKPDKVEKDFINIAAVCAVLTNFVDEEEEEV